MGSLTDGADNAAIKRREFGVLIVLGSVQFTSIVDFMLVMPLGPQLMRSLKIDAAQFGLIVSAYTIAAGIAGLVAAPIVDRFGRKVAFLSLYLGFLVGTMFCGLAGTFPTLLAARVLTGAFGGILGGMAMTIIGDVFPANRHATATGALMSAFSLASVLGVPFGLAVGIRNGWQAPFLLLAGLGVFVLAYGIWSLPTLRGHLDHNTKRAHPFREIWATASHPNHLPAFALIVVLMLGGFAVIPYISTYLVKNTGMVEANLPWLYIVGGVLTLGTSPLIGRLADRFGRLRIYYIIAPFSALAMFLVTVLPRVPMAVSVFVVAMILVGNSGRMVAAMAMIIASVEPRRRGSFMSVYSSVQHISGGIGSYLGGAILGTAADGSLTNYGWDGVIAVVATLFSLYLASRLRPANSTASMPITPEFSLAAADAANADQNLVI
jgi:predicted MFS family arabinose efflux permease